MEKYVLTFRPVRSLGVPASGLSIAVYREQPRLQVEFNRAHGIVVSSARSGPEPWPQVVESPAGEYRVSLEPGPYRVCITDKHAHGSAWQWFNMPPSDANFEDLIEPRPGSWSET